MHSWSVLPYRSRLPGYLLLAVLCCISPLAAAQDVEWPHYGRDLASTKYAPLDQITADNVGELEIVWSWDTPDNAIFRNDGEASAAEYKATPIMVDGVLYVSTSLGNVAAVDAVTGEQLWVFETDSWRQGQHPNYNNNHRGVSYWSDGEVSRVFMAANDGILWSLDARTGEPDPTFGDQGWIDLKQGLGSEARIGDYGNISPPLVVNDTLVVGSSLHDVPRFMEQVPPGHVRAFDARTGQRRWMFHVIPQGDEEGAESWEDESWRFMGGANVWTVMSADPEAGLVYLPTSTPSNDWYGGHRKGNNLYAESLVALDIDTGDVVWHYQTTRHGLWDYDLPAAPNLVDIEVDGEPIKAVAQISKQGFVFVFDRLTGEPVWPIEMRPVPQTDVPGERTSPTQPFPTRPAPFEPQGLTDETLINLTPELRTEALAQLEGIDYGELYTPPSLRGMVMVPGYSGGAGWWGAAVDPQTNILYVPSYTLPRFIKLREPEPGESDYRYIRDRSFTINGPRGLPLTQPPWGRITAIDLDTGEHVWKVPHGEGIRQRLIDMGIEDPGPVGNVSKNGPLLTRTLLFVGQLDAGRPVFRAFDKMTGEIVHEMDMPLPPTGTPMSYRIDGRQYIVMAAGAGPATRLLALALQEGE